MQKEGITASDIRSINSCRHAVVTQQTKLVSADYWGTGIYDGLRGKEGIIIRYVVVNVKKNIDVAFVDQSQRCRWQPIKGR